MIMHFLPLNFLQNSSTYWEGDAKAESLQRIYGISFPDAKQVQWYASMHVQFYLLSVHHLYSWMNGSISRTQQLKGTTERLEGLATTYSFHNYYRIHPFPPLPLLGPRAIFLP